MALESTRGLVISERSYNESDKIITIFSENGKFQAIANGVKNPKSSLSAGCRLFAWSEFQYFPGKTFAKITQANLIDPFYNISSNLELVSYASYIADLIKNFYDDNQLDKVILKHLVYYFYYINSSPDKVLLLTLTFQLKLLTALGIIPNFNSILSLDSNIPIYFSITDANFDNKRSTNKLTYRLNKNEIDLLLHLYKNPISTIFKENLNLEKINLVRLIEIFNSFIESQLSKQLKSFKILKELNQGSL